MPRLKTIEWSDGAVRLIDQTLLPNTLVYLRIDNVKDMFHAIRSLQVRGAPAIGIAAAYGLFLAVTDFPDDRSVSDFVAYVDKNIRYLAGARPTAVNLFWALDRLKRRLSSLTTGVGVIEMKSALLDEAHRILEEDKRTCRRIGEEGAALLTGCRAILTHCNAGGLATSEYGTALAPVYVSAERGAMIHVFADETRPLLQGARITAFELKEAGIPVTVICDNMAASVMHKGMVDAVIVGADRITAHGDTANKIGTYGVALLARAHKIPFYVAAPLSTFDLAIDTGDRIPIEERDPEEVSCGFGRRTVPQGVAVYNPAFDVTPHDLITAFVTEKGVIRPPFAPAIRAAAPIVPGG